MRYTSAVVGSLPSWPKTLVLIYILINVKSLPFAWHLRVLYYFLTNVSRRAIPPKPRRPLRVSLQSPTTTTVNGGLVDQRKDILTHPLFQPVTLTTRTPLMETDYNLHKSNSTYFADMDVSRTKLVTRLFSPGWRKIDMELEKEGCKGRMSVALGGVHATFKKEIGMYEKVELTSRVCTWDAKWVVVVSYFVRRKATQGRAAAQAENIGQVAQEEVCAIGLSKYVCKKGRLTVKPERILRLAGWLPKKPSEDNETSLESASPSNYQTPEWAGGRRSAGSARGGNESMSETSRDESGTTVWKAEAWSWEELEEERQRGLRLAGGWLALDSELYDKFERN